MATTIDRLEDDKFAERILGRQLVTFPLETLSGIIAAKSILVTGAGGYIGSALMRLLARLKPARLVLADNCEHALYEIDRELRNAAPTLRLHPVICDVRDRNALTQLFLRFHPEIVFHAAALKHLPLTEANVREAVLTNVIGTSNLVDCARSAQCEALIHISTDKAVAPTSMLGMTKRAAELVCQNGHDPDGFASASVRFNNVFGSTGSVVPLFLDQIAKGRRLTITHPAMNRYFVTASEATALVIAALGLSQADPVASGAVFVLEAGEPIAIVDLARRILIDAGQDPDASMDIIGMRRGEKLDETLIAPSERRSATGSPWIVKASAEQSQEPDVNRLIADLQRDCDRFDEVALRRHLVAATVGSTIGRSAELPMALAQT